TKTVEIIHVVAAQVDLKRVENIGQGNAHCANFGPVHLRIKLWSVGSEAIESADNARLLIGRESHLVGLGLEFLVVNITNNLDHQFEAARIPQAIHCRRPENIHARFGYFTLVSLAKLGSNGIGAHSRTATLIERLERDKRRAEIRTDGIEDE